MSKGCGDQKNLQPVNAVKALSAAVDSGHSVQQAMPVTSLSLALYQLADDKLGGLRTSTEVVRYFLRLGTMGFGGPVALCGLMEKDLYVSLDTVRQLLEENGYRRRQMLKYLDLGQHPDRDAQFVNVARIKERYLNSGDPIVSIDTKERELLGMPCSATRGGRQRKANDERVLRGMQAVLHCDTYEFFK